MYTRNDLQAHLILNAPWEFRSKTPVSIELHLLYLLYIGSSLKYPSSCVLLTIFTSNIFASKLRVAVHKSQNAAITSDLNHSVTMQLAIAESHYAASLRFTALSWTPIDRISRIAEYSRAKHEKFTRHVIVSVKETRFDEASEPNQTKSRTIALRYDAPFYRLYY